MRCLAETRSSTGLGPQTRLIIHDLVGQLTWAARVIGRRRWILPPVLDAVMSALPSLQELGPRLGPDATEYLDWYLSPSFPPAEIRGAEFSYELFRTCSATAVAMFPDNLDLKAVLAERGVGDDEEAIQRASMEALARGWPNDDTRSWLTTRATTDAEGRVRAAAMCALAEEWLDERTYDLLKTHAATDGHWAVRRASMEAPARGWPDDDTRSWLTIRATTDADGDVRRAAMRALAQGWPEKRAQDLLEAGVSVWHRHDEDVW